MRMQYAQPSPNFFFEPLAPRRSLLTFVHNVKKSTMLNLQLRKFVSSSSTKHLKTSVAWADARQYSSNEAPKASVKLIAELRKQTEVSMSKAREALIATNNDLSAALEWVKKDLEISGAKKAEKVGGRETKEGLVAVSVLSPGLGEGTGGVRAAMIELNCETDFVGRNDLFAKLSADIAHTCAYHAEEAIDFQENPTLLRPFNTEVLLDAPFIQKDPTQSLSSPESSVQSAIRDTIAKVGENITLRRAVSVVLSPAPPEVNAGLRVASFIHNALSIDRNLGRMGTLSLLYLQSPSLLKLFKDKEFREDLEKLERGLTRQIVGFDPRSIRHVSGDPETALYKQPFALFPGAFAGQPVGPALDAWAVQKGLIVDGSDAGQGLAVSEFIKWSVGQDLSSGKVVSSKSIYLVDRNCHLHLSKRWQTKKMLLT